jgi:DNA-binding PadR family transcriptional regulator
MKVRDISLLGHALLGLLQQHPSSGYDLRKIFALTPVGSFSDSPGAIYPALHRLEEGGFIRGRLEETSGLRRRKMFRLTPAGVAALKKWLAKPVHRDEVVRSMDELMLRFAFMDVVIGEAASIQFLNTLERELKLYVPTLREYLGSQRANLPISGRLALESGIRGYEAQLQWAKSARAAYEQAGKGGTS